MKLNVEKAFKEEQEKAEKQRRDRVALAKDHLKQYVYINYLFLYILIFLIMDIAFFFLIIYIKVTYANIPSK